MRRTAPDLRIVIDAMPHRRAAVRLATSVAEHWPGRVRVEQNGVHGPAGRSEDGSVTLRIGSASWIRPVLSLDFGAPVVGDLRSALRLGLSSAAWEGRDAWEPWFALRSTQRPRPIFGTLRQEAGWVLVESGSSESAAAGLDVARDAQIHGFIGGAAKDPAVEVRWKRQPSTLGWLLGQVDLVVAPPGPLAYDAARCGLPVHHPGDAGETVGPVPGRLHAQGLGSSAVHVLSPLMQGSAVLWPAIVERLHLVRDGAAAIPPLVTPELVATVRDGLAQGQSRQPSRLELAQRRARKLLRDPEAFLHDSRHAPLRWVGRVVSAETSRCPRRHAGRWVRWV